MLTNRCILIVGVPSPSRLLNVEQCGLPGIWGWLFNPKSKKEVPSPTFSLEFPEGYKNHESNESLPPPPTTISLFPQKMQVEALYLLHFIYKFTGPYTIRTPFI